jgi:hypothetical protein
VLNQAAWEIAADAASPPALLARAEQAAQRATALMPDEDSLVDTRAYLLHRLGRTDEALALERGAVWRTPKPALATMLLRMLEERRAPDGIEVRRESSGDVVIVGAPGTGAVVYVRVDGASRALLRVVLPPGDASPVRVAAPAALSALDRLHVLAMDASPTRPERSSGVAIEYIAIDDATLLLPWP